MDGRKGGQTMKEVTWEIPPRHIPRKSTKKGDVIISQDPISPLNIEPKTTSVENKSIESNEQSQEPKVQTLVNLDDKEIQSSRVFKVKRHGMLDNSTIEALLISAFLKDIDTDDLLEGRDKEAEVVFAAPVRGDWFTNRFLGSVFDTFRGFYQQNRERISPQETANFVASQQGQTRDQSNAFEDEMNECLAARLLHRIRPEYLVDEITQRYRTRVADKLIQDYVKKRQDPNIGPIKALDEFRLECMQKLVSPENGEIIAHDWIRDFSRTMTGLKDMKLHPEKYSGFKCGISAIDEVTKGFRPGHLTVFVGAHGGFKSTTMINVGYGLWTNGYNVLYASLEMEADLMEIKLWCRSTRAVSFSKAYSGLISERGDWDRIKELEQIIETNTVSEKEIKKLKVEKERLQTAIVGIKEGSSEMELFHSKYNEFQNAKNKFYIINAGQSNKVKPSQLERWIKEMEGVFRPDVIIVDYLDLVAPETPYPDRRDQELGDICKYFRQMGKTMNFSVITAAQLKRAAIDRMRKSGANKPEKMQLGTDDIAGSHMIGADADEVMILCREDGGNRIRMFIPKSRHGVPDVDRGKILQVDPDTCTIQGDDVIEDTNIRSSMMGPKDISKGLKGVGTGKHVIRGETDDLFSPEDMKAIFGEQNISADVDNTYVEQMANAISSDFEPKTTSVNTQVDNVVDM
jgi:replicative DNA helicase